MRRAIKEFETALAAGNENEIFFQKWLESQSWAFGNAYTFRDEVRAIALGDQVDHLVKHTAHGLRDIFELKRPDSRLLLWDNDHRSYYWSAETSHAIGQCHRYLDALHDEARNGLRDNPDIVAYHPRAFIIQGRSAGWSQAQLNALHGLNSRLHGIQIMTYDQLLAQANRLLDTLSTETHAHAD